MEQRRAELSHWSSSHTLLERQRHTLKNDNMSLRSPLWVHPYIDLFYEKLSYRQEEYTPESYLTAGYLIGGYSIAGCPIGYYPIAAYLIECFLIFPLFPLNYFRETVAARRTPELRLVEDYQRFLLGLDVIARDLPQAMNDENLEETLKEIPDSMPST